MHMLKHSIKMALKVGDMVSFLDDVGEGEVVEILDDHQVKI